jgi:hypothetical protein
VGRREKINVGIAMVIPAHKILEILEHPELAARMHQAHVWVYNNPANVLDGGSPPSVKKGLEEFTTRELTISAASTTTEGSGFIVVDDALSGSGLARTHKDGR